MLIHKRQISVPKAKEGLIKLEYDTATDDELLTWHVNDEEFDSLYPVLININKQLNTLIDDYEDESITEQNKLLRLKSYLEELISNNQANEVIIQKLIALVKEAEERQTGVFFYL